MWDGPHPHVGVRPVRLPAGDSAELGHRARGLPALEVVEHVVTDLLPGVGVDVVARARRQGDLEAGGPVRGLTHPGAVARWGDLAGPQGPRQGVTLPSAVER